MGNHHTHYHDSQEYKENLKQQQQQQQQQNFGLQDDLKNLTQAYSTNAEQTVQLSNIPNESSLEQKNEFLRQSNVALQEQLKQVLLQINLEKQQLFQLQQFQKELQLKQAADQQKIQPKQEEQPASPSLQAKQSPEPICPVSNTSTTSSAGNAPQTGSSFCQFRQHWYDQTNNKNLNMNGNNTWYNQPSCSDPSQKKCSSVPFYLMTGLAIIMFFKIRKYHKMGHQYMKSNPQCFRWRRY